MRTLKSHVIDVPRVKAVVNATAENGLQDCTTPATNPIIVRCAPDSSRSHSDPRSEEHLRRTFWPAIVYRGGSS